MGRTVKAQDFIQGGHKPRWAQTSCIARSGSVPERIAVSEIMFGVFFDWSKSLVGEITDRKWIGIAAFAWIKSGVFIN